MLLGVPHIPRLIVRLLTVTEIDSSGFEDTHRSIDISRLQSDIVLFSHGVVIWINGTQPVTTWGGVKTPRNTFPFARLASTTLAGGVVDLSIPSDEQYDHCRRAEG